MALKTKGMVPTPIPMPEHLKERGDFVQKRLPPMIVVFVVLCFWRAFWFMSAASILGIAPNSKAAHFVDAFFSPRLPHISAEFAFLAGAIVYALIGWGWLRRDWKFRWFTMFLTGATAARTITLYLAAKAAGLPSARTDGQHAELVVSTLLNIFICAYLAFYPGISEVFKESS
jgi:hypothetical protein